MTTVLQTSSAGTTILQDGTTTIVTQTVQGVKGDTGADGKDGDSVAELEPRVSSLEIDLASLDQRNGIKTNDW